MRLVRVGLPGAERPAVLASDGGLRDLSGLTGDIDAHFLAHGIPAARAALESGALPELAAAEPRLGPPITRPGKVVGIGLNYITHAREIGVEPPAEPVVFLKASTSVSGPQDSIRLLPAATKTDFEVELGVVLGGTLRGEADPARALQSVAGYLVANDVSDRELQLERGGTWTKGKSADTFCPIGPWLVTADEVTDPHDLTLELSVNGVRRQIGHTGDMVFTIGELLCYVSQVMTLEPGDLVITGTPAGVAMGQPEPKPYLRDGDVVELEIQGLGRQRCEVTADALVAGRGGP